MRGLALEGGGAKGAYHAGAIKAFNKKGIKFDGVAGTSIGAINAAFYASNNIKKMNELWLSADSKDLFGFESDISAAFKNGKINKEILIRGLNSITKIIKNGGIDITNIRKVLENNIDEKKLRKSNIDFGLVTFNISDFKPIVITIKDIPEGKVIDYIIASAYLPCFKFERIIDNKYYFDGGIYLNCPIDLFIDKNYEEIYAVKAWRNTRIKYKKRDGVKVIIITPSEDLGSIINFSPRTAKWKMNLGYYDTLRVLDKLDGKKYYFKRYSDKYYDSLFDKSTYKKMTKKYSNNFLNKSSKVFIITTLEKICKEFRIKRFAIHNIPLLIVKLKFLMSKNKNNIYYDFIDKIQVKFI